MTVRFCLHHAGLLRLLASAMVASVAITLPLAAPATASGTLEAVRTRGHVLCGVGAPAPGLAAANSQGNWSGILAEYCHALGAAVLGSKDAIKIIPLTASERNEALKSGAVDVLLTSAAWTLSRDTELGQTNAGILFHDGQGFLVHRGDAVTSVLELSGSTICALSGTTAEQGVTDYFKTRQMKFQLVVSERWSELVKAYSSGGCTLLTGDISLLASERARMEQPADHLLLPELITKEPLGPMVREGDDMWQRIVRWTLQALVAAEELGVTSENAAEMRSSSSLNEVRRLLGIGSNSGQGLGLSADWAFNAVSQVGNYGELFDRNLGSKSSLKLERGLDALWTKGGLMYAPPLR